jgi:mRNA interferase RelE/StbE
MMQCRVELSREAAADIDALQSADRKLCGRIIKKLGFLEGNPQAGKPLVGNHAGEFSLRIGDYRIVYEIDQKNHIVYILTIKHRRHVYQ